MMVTSSLFLLTDRQLHITLCKSRIDNGKRCVCCNLLDVTCVSYNMSDVQLSPYSFAAMARCCLVHSHVMVSPNTPTKILTYYLPLPIKENSATLHITYFRASCCIFYIRMCHSHPRLMCFRFAD